MNPSAMTAGVNQKDQQGRSRGPARAVEDSIRQQYAPLIHVSESDGTFNAYADFSLMAELSDDTKVTVVFAHQGLVSTHGTIQRYVPTPTDSEIEHATVKSDSAIVRISVPTPGLGDCWRSLIMW
ncbi:MAG: hypothetical protein H0V35_05110 [Nitrospira sp.]|nr:hypothetical protein [Nitrospira sp.]